MNRLIIFLKKFGAIFAVISTIIAIVSAVISVINYFATDKDLKALRCSTVYHLQKTDSNLETEKLKKQVLSSKTMKDSMIKSNETRDAIQQIESIINESERKIGTEEAKMRDADINIIQCGIREGI